jgi:hypothetical protein
MSTTKTRELTLEPGQPLAVRGGNLAVELRAEDAPASIEVPGSDDPAAPEAVDVSTEGGRVVVTAAPYAGGGERVLRVRIPASERELEVETANGRVLLDAVTGKVKVHATNGRVELRGIAGEATVVCANGSIEAQAPRGSLDLSTANGRILVREAQLKSGSFKSGNGRIAVQVRPEGAANLGIFAGNGRVELAVPNDAGFRIKVRTRGRLHNNLESYSVSSEQDSTVVERGGGELAVLIQAFKGVRLVKYDDFGKEMDEPGPIPGVDFEEMQDLFGRLNACFGDFSRRFDFADEIPKIAQKMREAGARFGRMGEDFSRRFTEAQHGAGSRDREVDMILELLKDGKISADEAERLINAVRNKQG